MSIDTKALIAATPATVALVRRELDKSRESQRGECSIPKAVKVDCAMVERLCRIAEKQADRLAELEAELATAQAEVREWQRVATEQAQLHADDTSRLEAEAQELRERAEKAERNYQWMVERAADQHLSGYRELARRAADAENVADGLRAELARVRELAAKWRAAPQNPDEPLLAMAADELEAALSQAAEQHDPLAVSDHCPECSEPDPECVCGEQPAERESLPLMARDTCTNCGGTGVGGYHVHAPQEDAVEALRCEACDGFGYISAAQESGDA